MRLGTADVLVRAKTDKYKKDLKGAERDTEAFAKRVRASVDKTARSFTIMASVVSVAFVAASLKAIEFGSDLEETQGKFDVVFRGMTETAEDWATNLQDNYAMAETESKKYLSSLQDLIVPTGIARDEAGRLSNEFVKLAADLGSFNNLPTQKVIEDIQSALAGGSETLTKYGINVKVAALKQEALNQGWIKGKEKMTQAQRQQAILNIMMREGADAVGDMARTAESYANQLKKAQANVSDLTTEIGKALLPVATDVVSIFNDWFKINKDVINQNIPGYVENIGSAFVFLLDAADGVKRVFEIVGKSIALLALQIESGLLQGAHGLVSGPVAAMNLLIETFNRLPGIADIPLVNVGNVIKEEWLLTQRAIAEAEKDINKLFETDLAGTALVKSFQKAKVEAEALKNTISTTTTTADSKGANDKGSGFNYKKDPFGWGPDGLTSSIEDYKNASQEIINISAETGQSIDSAFENSFKGLVKGMADGSKSIKDIASDLLSDLADSFLNYAMSIAKSQLLASQGGSTSDSLWGALFKGVLGGISGGGSGGGILGSPGVSSGGVAHFADGGFMGSDGTRRAFPAVIHEGEVVGTPNQMADQFGNNQAQEPTTNVTNNYNVSAMDSKSFTEFFRSNPGAMVAAMSDQANKGNSGFKSAVQKAVR